MTRQGNLYILEGPDGIGKSTLAETLVNHLQKSGVDCEHLSFPGRDTGSLGRLVYDLHHGHQMHGVNSIAPASLQILHIAAHVDAIKRRILPTLEAGRTVVLDRFWWSTWVYGLVDGVSKMSLQLMLNLEVAEWSNVVPTTAFLVTRNTPLRKETSVERWDALRDHYTELAEVEGVRYPVQVIHNEESEQEALNQILRAISYVEKNPSKPMQLGLEFPKPPAEKVKKN